MKKIFTVLFLIVSLIMPCSAYADDYIRVFLNDREIEFDQPPIIYNDLTFVPFRAIFEAMGMVVQWDNSQQRATAFNHEYNISFLMNYDYIFINGIGIPIEYGPIIENSRMLIPLRALIESVNGDVYWDGDNKYVYINSSMAVDTSNWPYEVLDLTNEVRRQYGLPEFTWDNNLAKVGREHCMDMAAQGYFDHNSPDGSTPFDRLSRAGISYYAAAENIAAGQIDPKSVVDAWMNSEEHRENILNPLLRKMGVGISRNGDYGIYWAQEFTN